MGKVIALVFAAAAGLFWFALDRIIGQGRHYGWFALALAIVLAIVGVGLSAQRFHLIDWAKRNFKGQQLIPSLLMIGGTLAFLVGAGWYLIQLTNAGTLIFAEPVPKAFQDGQPTIRLVAPKERSELRWNPPEQYGINTRPESKPFQHGTSWAPVLTLKNVASTAAQDVVVTWRTETVALEAIMRSSDRLANYSFEIDGSELRLGARDKSRIHTTSISHVERLNLAYITKETELPIPFPIWNQAAAFFVATLRPLAGARSEPFTFSASVEWNIPEEGRPAKFRVKATAVNAKPTGVQTPEVLALIDFDIETIQ